MSGAPLLLSVVALAMAPAAAAKKPLPSLADRMADVASNFCVAAIANGRGAPRTASETAALYADHGLTAGVPTGLLDTLGPGMAALGASETLASGRAADGAFVVVLDPEDKRDPTCLVIAYKAPKDKALVKRIGDRMAQVSLGWRKKLPLSGSAPGSQDILVHPAEGRPRYMAGLGKYPALPRVAAMVAVEGIAANTIIPEGF